MFDWLKRRDSSPYQPAFAVDHWTMLGCLATGNHLLRHVCTLARCWMLNLLLVFAACDRRTAPIGYMYYVPFFVLQQMIVHILQSFFLCFSILTLFISQTVVDYFCESWSHGSHDVHDVLKLCQQKNAAASSAKPRGTAWVACPIWPNSSRKYPPSCMSL